MQQLTNLIRSIGTPEFAFGLRAYLLEHVEFDTMVVSRFSGDAPPETLYHDLDDAQATIAVHFYATGPYLLDPLYLAIRRNVEEGAYRTLDIAPQHFFRSEYFRKFYRNLRISDEVGLLLSFNSDIWCVISLARSTRGSQFSEREVEALSKQASVVAAAIQHQWVPKKNSVPENVSSPAETKFREFAADILSPREQEIVQLILQGHSSRSAAAFLGIKEGTVKVHRHSIHSKLGISSQVELFAMATRYFAESYQNSMK